MKFYYKVKEKKLEQENICNYLFNKDGTYYFANKKHNWLFVNTEESQGKMFLSVENWLFEFYNTIEKTTAMPSIAIFDGITTADRVKKHCKNYIVEYNNKEALINQESVISLLESSDFESVMEKIIESRKDCLSAKELIVVLDGIDENKYPKLLTYLTVARSRNIFFIIVSYNKEELEQESLIKEHFDVKYLCDKDEIKEISITEFRKTEIIKL